MTRRTQLRVIFAVGGLAFAGGVGFGWALENDPDFGPWLANSARAVVGPELVAEGEELYYGARDAWERARYAEAAPASMLAEAGPAAAVGEGAPMGSAEAAALGSAEGAGGAVPGAGAAADGRTAAAAGEPASAGAPGAAAQLPPFHPADFVPPFPTVAAEGDGRWQPWAAGPAGAPALLWRAQVHPDPERTKAVAVVVAIDASRMEIRPLPGRVEPVSAALTSAQRPGVVPTEHHAALVAAFNGGWQATHGQLGMRIGELVVLPPINWGCTFAQMRDGGFRIAPWPKLAALDPQIAWYRQTPPCLVVDGKHDRLLETDRRRWGLALNGETVVRRSGLGLDASGRVLYYVVGDSLTAAATARSLEAAGAVSAMMLDINYSFPNFVTFAPTGDPATPLAWTDHIPEKPDLAPDLYIGKGATKDFFYLTWDPTAPPLRPGPASPVAAAPAVPTTAPPVVAAPRGAATPSAPPP